MAVTISGTSGTWSNGNSVTISGSGFGAKATAAPSMWDQITNGNYGTIVNGATVPAGPAYLWSGDSETGIHSNVVFSTSTTRANSKPTYTANAFNGVLKNTTTARTKTGSSYLSWWFRPMSLPGGDQSSKLVRVSDSRNLTNCTLSWTNQQLIIYDTISAGGYVLNNWFGYGSLSAGSWNFIELISTTSTRNLVLRINGSNTLNATWSAGDFDPNILWMLGWDGGGNSPTAMQWYMDCVYHDMSHCRVMLGNATTYSACTSFEMQPPTAWSTTAITATVNVGAFTNGQTAYLYVFDATGTPNATGTPITINSGSTVISPVANFSGIPTSGQAPLLVSYSDLSTNTPTSWAWNFGANASPASATTQNPSTTYVYGGAKNVALTVANSAGSDDEIKNGYISVRYLKPTNFGAN